MGMTNNVKMWLKIKELEVYSTGRMTSRLPRKTKRQPLHVSSHRTWCYRLAIQLLERMKQEPCTSEASLDGLRKKRAGCALMTRW